MKFKLIIPLLCLYTLLTSQLYGQADPGSAGITFSKSIIPIGGTAVLQVQIGNYSAGLAMGTALAAYDATFTITIPSVLKLNGPLNFSDMPFSVSMASQMTNSVSSTVIILVVPNGIPKGVSGFVSIPLIGYKEDISILYATVRTDANLSNPPSGNAIPNNDLQSAPVMVSSALPVKLVSFNAEKENTFTNLSWTTSEEINSDRFEIEHSVNGKNWILAGTVNSNGDSKIKNEYHFSHKNTVEGNNYYRLKMIDKNLTYTFSAIRSVQFDEISLNVYPNPVSDILTINTSMWEQISNIQLVDMKGVLVYSSGNNTLKTISVGNLIEGMYLVKMTKADGSISVRKILVSR